MQTGTKKYITTGLLIWIGVGILCVGAYMMLLRPQDKEKQRLRSSIREKQQSLEWAQRVAQEENKTLLTEALEELENKLYDFAIDYEKSPELTLDISRLAKDIQVEDFSLQIRENDTATEIPGCNYICENRMSLKFAADFKEFAIFLNALERHRPVIFVDSFRIVRGQEEDVRHPVSMSLSVLVQKHEQVARK